jgi:hypothetical protein
LNLLKKSNNRVVVGILSDPHSGYVSGLLNPDTLIQDDEKRKIKFELNDRQKFVWEVYAYGVNEVFKLAGKDDILLFCLGDLTHGNKYIPELMSTRGADQYAIGEAIFDPWLQSHKNVKSIRIVFGTAAHNFGQGTSEIVISQRLEDKYPQIDTRCYYQAQCKILDKTVDIAHHGPSTGRRVWLSGNEARYYLRSIMLGDLTHGKTPPDLVLRGHRHVYIDEVVREGNYCSRIIIAPPLCLPGEFAIQVAQSSGKASVGILALEIENGKTITPFEFTQDFTTTIQETLI